MRGLIIVGCDDEHGVGADGAAVFREVDGVGGVVGAGTGDDGDAAGGMLYGEADGLAMLFVGKCGALTGGAGDDEGLDTLGDLPVDEAGEGGIVDAGLGQWGDEGGGDAAKDGMHCHEKNSFQIRSQRMKNSQCALHWL